MMRPGDRYITIPVSAEFYREASGRGFVLKGSHRLQLAKQEAKDGVYDMLFTRLEDEDGS